MELRTLKNSPQTFPEVPKQKKKLTSSQSQVTPACGENVSKYGDQPTGENVLKYGDRPTGENV
jgi:hypothetical protein